MSSTSTIARSFKGFPCQEIVLVLELFGFHQYTPWQRSNFEARKFPPQYPPRSRSNFEDLGIVPSRVSSSVEVKLWRLTNSFLLSTLLSWGQTLKTREQPFLKYPLQLRSNFEELQIVPSWVSSSAKVELRSSQTVPSRAPSSIKVELHQIYFREVILTRGNCSDMSQSPSFRPRPK